MRCLRLIFAGGVLVVWVAAHVVYLLNGRPLAEIPTMLHFIAGAMFCPAMLPEIIAAWRAGAKRNGK